MLAACAVALAMVAAAPPAYAAPPEKVRDRKASGADVVRSVAGGATKVTGSSIVSSTDDDVYGTKSGISMSTPMVTEALAGLRVSDDDAGSASDSVQVVILGTSADAGSLLSLWLNAADGSIVLGDPVDTSGDGTGDSTVGAVIQAGEEARVAPGTPASVLTPFKNLYEATNAAA